MLYLHVIFSLAMFATVQVDTEQQALDQQLADDIVRVSASISVPSGTPTLARQLTDYVSHQQDQLNQASSAAWSKIQSQADWESFRDDKLARLRQSLGQPDGPQPAMEVEVTGRHTDASGRFVVENIVYHSRPNVLVTANLYRPARPISGAPGILISHAHHTPKEHAELQAMGMTWARAGCFVLVPDHFGHGERRQHPFVSAESFPGSFRVSRQDYYFRYDLGIKLHLIGESLMSWLAWDLSRGVDVLLQQEGIDPRKIILLGAVAGGGDPAAVTAALDRRIAAAVPFNFGGPQPETAYPLPEDANVSFNYSGSGSWESTRNLTRSASDGFLPWVIVGSVAPRGLIYGHEFRWDQPRDPVWHRLQTVYRFYDQPDRLDYTHGRGELRGQPPEATHCTHIGAVHRQRIHSALLRWFQINVSPTDEILETLPVETLRCLSADSRRANQSTLVDFEALARERVAVVRRQIAQHSGAERRKQLQSMWSNVLGVKDTNHPSSTQSQSSGTSAVSRSAVTASPAIVTEKLRMECFSSNTEDGMHVPIVLLRSVNSEASQRLPVVLIVQTVGTATYMRTHAIELAHLVRAGHAVCMCDMRGTGDSRSASNRGRTSSATSISSSLLMLGDPLIAGQLRDLRLVWAWLKSRSDVDATKIQVWGDSRGPTLSDATDRVVPRDDDSIVPRSAEPAACLLALLLSLYEDGIHSLCLSGGLTNFRSALEPMQVRLPHDCVVPGLLRTGDIEELMVQAAQRLPLRGESLVDGHNRLVSPAKMAEYQSQLNDMASAQSLKLHIHLESNAPHWLSEQTAISR